LITFNALTCVEDRLRLGNSQTSLRLRQAFTIFGVMKPTAKLRGETPTRILFVCLGNICRSPAAEGVMRRLVSGAGLDGTIECDSAGTYGGHAGELPDARMRRAAAARGYDLTHRARQIRLDDFDRFDKIVVMDDSNYERVHRLAPSLEAAAKIDRMTGFRRRGPGAPHPDATHVPDPYYEGAEGFERVLDLLEDCCSGLLEHLQLKS
jgi:protein-tyrosine phosphatase